jgi:glycosyltransferase involved in cell wall biosynthesis
VPTSYHQAVSYIMDQIMLFGPQSILDLGPGFGKYGVLCRETLDVAFERYSRKKWATIIDGVEGWQEYRNPIHDYVYNKVYYARIQDQLPKLGMYDVVLLIDVLEHFPKEEGLRLLDEMLAHANKALIVATPMEPAPQVEYLGNSLEGHRSRWTPHDLAGFRYWSHVLPVDAGGGAGVFVILPDERRWAARVTPSLRAELNRVDAVWDGPAPPVTRPLRVTYVLPGHTLTGGMKMLIEQMRQLKRRGHTVQAVFRGPAGSPVMPPWADLRADVEVLVDEGKPIAAALPPSDVVVAGWFNLIEELAGSPYPVLYWEQGHEFLFGDVPPTASGAHWDQVFLRSMFRPVALAGVSGVVREVLAGKFGRRCGLVPNGIDTERFRPGPALPAEGRVLLVGNPRQEFKGFEVALYALGKVFERMPQVRVTWVCQAKPAVCEVPFPLEFVVNPPQERLPDLYRAHDVLLFTSWYEAFGMPPLEAMACGVPVVATNSLGVETYARPGENCLLADPGDVDSLAWGVLEVLRGTGVAATLREGALRTAAEFSWEAIAVRLEEALRRVAGSGVGG